MPTIVIPTRGKQRRFVSPQGDRHTGGGRGVAFREGRCAALLPLLPCLLFFCFLPVLLLFFLSVITTRFRGKWFFFLPLLQSLTFFSLFLCCVCTCFIGGFHQALRRKRKRRKKPPPSRSRATTRIPTPLSTLTFEVSVRVFLPMMLTFVAC
jgi:hypothetical protein